MSNIYVTEPPTRGKVILKTSRGDIDVELWSKETPKSARNFIQLCLEGYYDNTLFHRIVKETFIQGGDPTNEGTGGDSIYGGPFPDEFHSRLHFSHRGLLAWANATPGDNRSQFFITLNKTEWLERKHTIFGKVVGDTIFNVLNIGSVAVDEDDKPEYPVRIISTEVLLNPFDDIVPRELAKPSDTAGKQVKPKSNLRGSRKLALVSFGDETEQQPVLKSKSRSGAAGKSKASSSGFKSAHDLIESETLSKEAAVNLSELKQEPTRSKSEQLKEKVRRAATGATTAEDDFDQQMRDKFMERRKRAAHDDAAASNVDQQDAAAVERKSEYKRLKKDILRLKKQSSAAAAAAAAAAKHPDADLLTPLQAMREKYKLQKRQRGKQQADTMKKLEAFQTKLRQQQKQQGVSSKTETDTNGDEDDDSAWMTESLVFEKTTADASLMDEGEPQADGGLDVFDPLAAQDLKKSKAYDKIRRNTQHIHSSMRD